MTFDLCSETPQLMPIIDKFIAKYNFIDNEGDEFLLLTNSDAPNFQIISVNILQGVEKVRQSGQHGTIIAGKDRCRRT